MKVNSNLRNIFFSTVFIEAFKEDGTRVTGTGFTYLVGTQEKPIPLLVTARHVISEAATGSIRFMVSDGSGGPRLGQAITRQYADFKNHWYQHPDSEVDIAVKSALNELLPPAGSEDDAPFFRLVDSSLCPTQEQVDTLDLLEEVTFVGYPAGLYDTANYTPVMMQGVAATPIEIDWHHRPVFLINAPVVSGLSGSPVFTIGDGMFRERGGVRVIGNRVLFLGVLTGGYQVSETGTMTSGDAQSTFSFMNKLSLGAVHKWTAVADTIDRFLHDLDKAPGGGM
ncbi:trypsin-like peptidase domain-containing protein [Actinophytocola sp. KF-1]